MSNERRYELTKEGSRYNYGDWRIGLRTGLGHRPKPIGIGGMMTMTAHLIATTIATALPAIWKPAFLKFMHGKMSNEAD